MARVTTLVALLCCVVVVAGSEQYLLVREGALKEKLQLYVREGENFYTAKFRHDTSRFSVETVMLDDAEVERAIPVEPVDNPSGSKLLVDSKDRVFDCIIELQGDEPLESPRDVLLARCNTVVAPQDHEVSRHARLFTSLAALHRETVRQRGSAASDHMPRVHSPPGVQPDEDTRSVQSAGALMKSSLRSSGKIAGLQSNFERTKKALIRLQTMEQCTVPHDPHKDALLRDKSVLTRKCPWWVYEEQGSERGDGYDADSEEDDSHICEPGSALTYSFEKEFSLRKQEDMEYLFNFYGPRDATCRFPWEALTPQQKWRFFKETWLDHVPEDFDRTKLNLDSLLSQGMGPGGKNSCQVDSRYSSATTLYQRKTNWWLSPCIELDNDLIAEVKSSSFEYRYMQMHDHMSQFLNGAPGTYSALQIHVTFPQPQDSLLRQKIWAVAIYLGDYLFAKSFMNAVFDVYCAPFTADLQAFLLSYEAPLELVEGGVMVKGLNDMPDALKYGPVGIRMGMTYNDETRIGLELRKGDEVLPGLGFRISQFLSGTNKNADGENALCIDESGTQCVTVDEIHDFVQSSRLSVSSEQSSQSKMQKFKIYSKILRPMKRIMEAKGFANSPSAVSLVRCFDMLTLTDWAKLPTLKTKPGGEEIGASLNEKAARLAQMIREQKTHKEILAAGNELATELALYF